MSRKEYEQAAALVASYPNRGDRCLLALAFARFFQADSPKFDRVRFENACDPTLATNRKVAP